MGDKCEWFSCDVDTGEVVAKTEINEDGSVNRYEYTVPDNIKEGHGDKYYESYEDFINDNPSFERDKKDEESIYRYWAGNGFDLGMSEIKKTLCIKKWGNIFMKDNYNESTDLIYRFKFYFADGTSKLSNCKSKNVENLYYDLEGILDVDTYKSLCKSELTTHQLLLLASKSYPSLYAFRNKKIIKIEIINTENNEIIDSINCK